VIFELILNYMEVKPIQYWRKISQFNFIQQWRENSKICSVGFY